MMSLLVVCAILLAVILGYITRINIGLFAMVFAYLLGCFGLQLTPGEIINMWPLKIFFVIFSVCLFYSFAIVNGTLKKLASYLLYRCRRVPQLLPYAIFLITALLAGLGAGYYTVLAFMAPVTLLLCQRTGMSVIMGAMAVNYGALSGANFVASQSGVIFRSLMTSNGITDNSALMNSLAIFISTTLMPIVVISVFMLISRQYSSLKNTAVNADLPDPLNHKQKITLWLISGMIIVVLAAPVAHLLLAENHLIYLINSKIDIGFIAVLFSVIALLFRLADERQVITTLPWATLIMICGVGMLISVAIKAGTINALAAWISGTMPPVLVPLVFGVVAAFMSIFASTLGVVTPALFPLVPAIATALSINPMVIFVAIVTGAQATSISPFSSGGSLLLSSCPDQRQRNYLFSYLLLQAVPTGFIAALLFNLLLTFFF